MIQNADQRETYLFSHRNDAINVQEEVGCYELLQWAHRNISGYKANDKEKLAASEAEHRFSVLMLIFKKSAMSLFVSQDPLGQADPRKRDEVKSTFGMSLSWKSLYIEGLVNVATKASVS